MAPSTSRQHTILVVDDEFPSLDVLELLLSGEGFRVLTASDGEEALSVLETELPDIVLTDQQMPKMTGTELCAAMGADSRVAAIPIILMSAGVVDELPPSVVAFFAKPPLFSQLVGVIRGVIANNQADR